jgi:nucleotide-binding universal stress UspA family protein
MTKPIFVGINGSARSEAALMWALRRASGHKLPVLALYALDDRWMSPDFQYQELIREAGMELLQKAQHSARAQAPTSRLRSSSGTAARVGPCGKRPRKPPCSSSGRTSSPRPCTGVG